MLSGIIAALQIFIHKEGLSTAGRPQQKHIVILNQPHLQGLFLNVEPLRYKPEPVAHLQHAIRHSRLKSVIYSHT